MAGGDSSTPFLGQRYADIKRQVISSNKFFVDPEFPANDNSLSFTPGKMTGIVWKRPHDICMKPPQLFIGDSVCMGMHQGQLGNCWFVAACNSLAMNQDVLYQVIPNWREQDWDEEHPGHYAGIFHFRFWRYGTWLDVVIDDLLPTRDNELVYTHSNIRNEFWCALVEKAYAKLFGTYESLDGGELAEALEDFTGGVVENVQLIVDGYRGDKDKCAALYEMLLAESENKALCAAYIPANCLAEMERAIDVGLVKGHAYPISAVKKIPIGNTVLYNTFGTDYLNMLRLRIPWGKCEWSGPFSMSSTEFTSLEQGQRETMGMTFDDRAEFWMRSEDFFSHFTNVLICRLISTKFVTLQKPWFMSQMHGVWKAPHRAGGCVNYKDTYISNPQFIFDVSEAEDEIIVSVMQQVPRNTFVTLSNPRKEVIGFTLVQVEANRESRLYRTQEVAMSSVFKPLRSICARIPMIRGRYVAVPTVFEPGVEGAFTFRIYTSAPNNVRDLGEYAPSIEVLPVGCCGSGGGTIKKEAKLLTKITVVKVTGLEVESAADAEVYCVVINEESRVQSAPSSSIQNPEFSTSAVFFRCLPDKTPVTVEIWGGGSLHDEVLGVHHFHSTTEVDHQVLEVGLTDRKDKAVSKPGRLHVVITHQRNLKSL